MTRLALTRLAPPSDISNINKLFIECRQAGYWKSIKEADVPRRVRTAECRAVLQAKEVYMQSKPIKSCALRRTASHAFMSEGCEPKGIDLVQPSAKREGARL